MKPLPLGDLLVESQTECAVKPDGAMICGGDTQVEAEVKEVAGDAPRHLGL